MAQRPESVSPTDAADWHPARPAADILGNLRRFGIGHNDIVAADAVRGDGTTSPLQPDVGHVALFCSARPYIYAPNARWRSCFSEKRQPRLNCRLGGVQSEHSRRADRPLKAVLNSWRAKHRRDPSAQT